MACGVFFYRLSHVNGWQAGTPALEDSNRMIFFQSASGRLAGRTVSGLKGGDPPYRWGVRGKRERFRVSDLKRLRLTQDMDTISRMPGMGRCRLRVAGNILL